MPDQGQGVPGLHFNFLHTDLSLLVTVSSLCMYRLVSPEDVGGVPCCLAEVDLVSAVILVQGHLKQAVLSKQFKASGIISWHKLTSMNFGMLRAKESRVTGIT